MEWKGFGWDFDQVRVLILLSHSTMVVYFCLIARWLSTGGTFEFYSSENIRRFIG